MAITKVTSSVLSDSTITQEKLYPGFKGTSAISGTEINWDSSAVFTKTLGAATTFTYVNDEIGMVKDLVISGAYTITWPTGTKIIAGEYDTSGTANFIQIVKTGAAEYFLSISKEAS